MRFFSFFIDFGNKKVFLSNIAAYIGDFKMLSISTRVEKTETTNF
jgi:hypothetical protein